MKTLSEEIITRLRDLYSPGTRVELIRMNDPYNFDLRPGSQGTVTAVDSIGTVHVAWDCGSSLGVVYGEDEIRILKGDGRNG